MRIAMMAAVIFVFAAGAEENALKTELKDPDLAPFWIYDDLAKAMGEAKDSGKPICLTLRCVPCVAGKKLDAEVTHPTGELETLEKNFVCVRVIKTNGLDLAKFQFDLDQSIAVFFMNADGTIYGRYGSRAANQANSDNLISLASFKKSMERALALHKDYPNNKAALAGKAAGKPVEYATPDVIPGLKERATTPVTRKSCIHCHMVREFTLRAKWSEKKLTREDLNVYPLPAQIGLTMDVADGLVVKAVAANSAAAKAGFAVGDELIGLKDQPLISQADIQWVLHNTPDESELTAMVRRGGNALPVKLVVSGNWKEGDLTWRASSFSMRKGLRADPLSPDEKKKLGIADDQLALSIKNLAVDAQKALEKQGLKKGDVIVALDGNSAALTESQFLRELRLKHGPGDAVKFTVLRGGEKKEIAGTMW